MKLDMQMFDNMVSAFESGLIKDIEMYATSMYTYIRFQMVFFPLVLLQMSFND